MVGVVHGALHREAGLTHFAVYAIMCAGVIAMTTMNATAFRRNIFAALEQTVRYNEPLQISTKLGNAVVISEDDYRGMMETLHLTSMPGMREKLLEGKTTPLADCLPESEVVW